MNKGAAFLNNHGLKTLTPEETPSVMLLIVIPGKSLLDLSDELGKISPFLAELFHILIPDMNILSVSPGKSFFYFISVRIFMRIDFYSQVQVVPHNCETKDIYKIDPAEISDYIQQLVFLNIAKTVPVMSKGFEVETDLTLHALDKDLRISEIPVDYQERPRGSFSKLSTFSDGAKVLKTLFWIFKDFKPLHFFASLALVLFFLSLVAGSLPVWEYLQEQYVHRVPLAVLAVGLMILAMLFFSVGLVLDTVSKFHRLEHEMLVSRYMEMHRLRSAVDNSQDLKAPTDEGRVPDPAGRVEASGRS